MSSTKKHVRSAHAPVDKSRGVDLHSREELCAVLHLLHSVKTPDAVWAVAAEPPARSALQLTGSTARNASPEYVKGWLILAQMVSQLRNLQCRKVREARSQK